MTVLGLSGLFPLSVLAGNGCAKEPSSRLIKSVHLNSSDPIEVIIRLAAEDGICLGIHADASNVPLPLDDTNVSWVDVLKHFFPNDEISVAGDVLIVNAKGGSAWLDYRIKKFSSLPASLEANSDNLWLDLKFQVEPMQGGFAGSMPTMVPSNRVSAFTVFDKSVRDVLNELLERSSKGGAWIVVDDKPEIAPPPTARPFWIEIPYGGALNNLRLR
jgi:hypothetical protein